MTCFKSMHIYMIVYVKVNNFGDYNLIREKQWEKPIESVKSFRSHFQAITNVSCVRAIWS